MITKDQLCNQKYDLEDMMTDSFRQETAFNEYLWNNTETCEPTDAENDGNTSKFECSKVAFWLRKSRSSYLAPAFCFNEFVDALVEDYWWDDIKYSLDEAKWSSSTLREHKKNILFENSLLSIKMGLDRYVALFSKYYKGVSSNSTFGHIDVKDNGEMKAKGFMAYVLGNKDKDPLLEFIYQQYWEWIKECVFPRDSIIHYQDSMTNYLFIWDDINQTGTEIPYNVAGGKNDEYVIVDYATLRDYVKQYYSFHEQVVTFLKAKAPI